MPAQRTGTRSRQQHSRNLGSKKGNVFKASSYSKSVLDSVVHAKKPRKLVVYVSKAEKTKIHDTESDVVVAKAPKVNKRMKRISSCLRFTIPNVPENNDLITQSYNRTHDGMKNVIRELKICMKARSGATDPDHVEMICQ